MFPSTHSSKHFCEGGIPVSAWEDARLSAHHFSYLTLLWKFQPKQQEKIKAYGIRKQEVKLLFKANMTIYIENTRESLEKNLLESGSNNWVSKSTVHKNPVR